MRTTLSLEDDVAALLIQIQNKTGATMKQLVNQALRHGLEGMSLPVSRKKQFRTQAVNLGRCYLSNLDNTWQVLAEVEGESYK